jgi:hypothetical protein
VVLANPDLKSLPSEGKGRTFESSRARQLSPRFQDGCNGMRH